VIHPVRRPFPQGFGIFETLRTENGLIAEYPRHMRRALKSAQALSLPMPREEALRDQVEAAMNDYPFELGRLRICISSSGLVVTHDPYAELTEGGYLTFSPHTSKAVGEQHKEFPYDQRYEIVDEARLHGFDDAIIFNSGNYVTETGLSNVAFLLDDQWITPPITAGILPGIMRAIAIERCQVQVRNIHITQIPQAREVVLLGSLRVVQPVVQIGEMCLACGDQSQAFTSQMKEKVEYFSVR
jgi:branched-subunit amino acid aminotransferase/4-amino-4-deoxychorismate lyase